MSPRNRKQICPNLRQFFLRYRPPQGIPSSTDAGPRTVCSVLYIPFISPTQFMTASPASTSTSCPSYSAISVSSCNSIRIHAVLGIRSIFFSLSHISASEGRPYPQSFGAMESSAVFASGQQSLHRQADTHTLFLRG